MNYQFLDIESQIFNANVIQVEDIGDDYTDLLQEEKKWIDEINPFYVQCLVDAYDIKRVHLFEKHGFHFVEFRIYKNLLVDDNQFSTQEYHPYKICLLNEEDYAEGALMLLNDTVQDDRFSIDPAIPPLLAKKRLERYLLKSFRSFPNEFVLGLIKKNNDQLIGIKTGSYRNKHEVLHFNTWLAKEYQNRTYLNIMEILFMEYLKQQQVSVLTAVTSGLSISEMNDSFREFNYTIDKTSILLRKIYQ